MGYTPELKDLIRRVEATRPARIEAGAPRGAFRGAVDGRAEGAAPGIPSDYKSEGKRTLKVGPNKGETHPVEIAELLESRSRLPQNVVLSQVDFEADLLIIGGGGAGTSAALIAAEQGLSSIIATKLRHGDSNTVMAEGGIQGASQEWDSPVYHYLDTMGGGHFQNDPALVAALANDAPLVIGWLERLGMLFDKLADGRMKVRHGGGTSRKRLHSAGDMTGAEIMRVLRDEARNRTDRVRVIEFAPAVELLLDKSGRCGGAVLYNLETHTYHVARAKAVISRRAAWAACTYRGSPARTTTARPATARHGLPGRRKDALHRRHPVPPDGRRLSGAEHRSPHHREGPGTGLAHAEHRRRAVLPSSSSRGTWPRPASSASARIWGRGS